MTARGTTMDMFWKDIVVDESDMVDYNSLHSFYIKFSPASVFGYSKFRPLQPNTFWLYHIPSG